MATVDVKISNFEGPLDLLLHLIDKNKYNIFDIPIVEITEQYLAYLDDLSENDYDKMSDFLLMAAQLISIKAKMLLPKEEEPVEDEGDPRDELVKPLLKSDILDIKDLTVGMKLQGTVRNVVDFGAFIDIGLHEDGLAHISKISDKYIKHPSEVLSVGDIVDCYVDEIKLDKNKVSLSLLEPQKK